MTVAVAVPAASGSGRAGLPVVLAAGLAGGAVDFIYATALAAAGGQPMVHPWQGVASGWIGSQAAREGGLATAGLGVATHMGVALAMGAVYVLVARRFPVVVRRPAATGALYGLLLYAAMYLVVLPIRWPGAFPHWSGARSLLDIGAHVFVGLAMAWTAARADRAINPKRPGARAG